MNIAGLVGSIILGLFVAAAVWTIADLQIRGTGVRLRPVCLDCGADRSLSAWLPLLTFSGVTSCTRCGANDPKSRTVWELSVAAYFGAAWVLLDQGDAIKVFAGSVPLLLILITDFKVQAVFVSNCLIAILIGLGVGLTDGPSNAAGSMFGMVIAGGATFFFMIIFRWLIHSIGVSVSAIAKSDIWVAFAVGAVVGSDAVLPTLVVAVSLAAVVGIVRPILQVASRSRVMPFGPFLIIGGLSALLI